MTEDMMTEDMTEEMMMEEMTREETMTEEITTEDTTEEMMSKEIMTTEEMMMEEITDEEMIVVVTEDRGMETRDKITEANTSEEASWPGPRRTQRTSPHATSLLLCGWWWPLPA